MSRHLGYGPDMCTAEQHIIKQCYLDMCTADQLTK